MTTSTAVAAAPDPFWTCPEHGTELAYVRSEDWQERHECPVAECKFGRWIS